MRLLGGKLALMGPILPEQNDSRPDLPPRLPGLVTQKPSRRRLVLAFTVAGVSDGFSMWLTFIPPLEWGLDLVTALLLFAILGWRWVMLPGLILEAVPGLSIFPFWVLVVVAVAVWDTPRPKPAQRP